MREDGSCGATAMRFVVDLLDAALEGEATEESLCVRLAGLVEAAAAAYIRLDTTAHTCSLTCWPMTVDVLRLKAVVEHLPRAYPLLLAALARSTEPHCLSASGEADGWRGSFAELLLWEILGSHDVAHVPLPGGEHELRMVLLARARPFSARHMLLLRMVQRPCAAVDQIGRRLRAYDELPDLPRAEAIAAHGLTAREIEVLRFLAEGMLARTIAAKLQVSPRTVHKHLASVYRKLDAHDRLLAVNRAQAIGLIPAQRRPPDEGGTSTHGGGRAPFLASD